MELKMSKIILGIDPGKEGGLALLQDEKLLNFSVMPKKENDDVCFASIVRTLSEWRPDLIVLERAMPIAMGSKHAFNYGRDFAFLEIAISLSCIPVTYVEPSKWAKIMHEGISSDFKPKAKSVVAFERLYSRFKEMIPKKQISKGANKGTFKYHDGIMEAILIAGYGQRKLD